MSTQTGPEIWRDIITRTHEDANFKQELFDSPKQVLGDAGLDIPEGAEVVIAENGPDRIYLVLPSSEFSPDQFNSNLAADEVGADAISEYNAACF